MRILLCVLSLFVMLSCNNGAHNELNAPPLEELAVESSGLAAAPQLQPVPERKLIRNGSISFEVDDVNGTRNRIAELVKEFGGYVSSEKLTGDDHRSYIQIVRVPGTSVDAFVATIESAATKINSKSLTVQDVTEEYVDVSSRLVAKQRVETRYLDIVRQAKTVKDILEVEEQIGIVRSEIESMQGKIKYMDNKVSYGTIELTYNEHYTIATPDTSSKFAESFRDGWHGWIGFLVALTRVWPFLTILSAIAWFVMRRRKPKQVTLQQ
jgi:hypothetical protein